MTDLLILLCTSAVNLLLAGVVLVRNHKAAVNVKFALVIFSFVGWTGCNYLADNNATYSLLFSKLTFVAALFIAYTMMELSNVFPTNAQVLSKRTRQYLGSILVVMGILSLSSFIVKSSVVQQSSGAELVVGSGYYAYILTIAIFLFVIVRNFYKQSKRATKVQKIQIRYLAVGVSIYVVLALGSQLILPLILDSWTSSRFGPVFTMVFIAFTTAAIVKHKLLDIRAVVARSMGYILSVLSLSALYVFITLLVVNNIFFKDERISTGQQTVYVVLAVFLSLTFENIKKYFDKVTSKLFFRDAYNSQSVIDQVSGVIVGNVDSHKVQKGSLDALSAALRPTYMKFIFISPSGALRMGDGVGLRWQVHEPVGLAEMLKKIGKKIILYDEIDERNPKIKDILKLEDISIVAPLFTKEETIGYLILGSKKSGNLYSEQDVGLLNTTTNELAVALQNAQRFDEIQAFNLTLQEKVTDATRELKSTNKKLVALDEAKDEFISMASHQLRTPLTSIKGYLSMMVDGDLGKVTPAQEKALKEAFGSSQRMVFLIADFLNVSRIKTGKFVIEPREVNLPEIVREEITQLREMASSRELNLVYEQPGEFPKVMLDDNKIRQVMMNMVDNAIYYTPSGGTITIQLYPTATDIIFKVIDTGIGVPKAEQHKLFAKFFRANNARRARPDGTGLGLFMAQKIIVEQGGAIIFESTEGKGSTFGFQFPIAKIRA